MLDPAFSTNGLLAERLRSLVEGGDAATAAGVSGEIEFEVFALPGANRDPDAVIDVVITVNEINDKHGTGPLVKRVFGDRRDVFAIRSGNHWGDHDFGSWSVCVPQRGRPRPECYRRALSALGNRRVGQVLCIPFYPDEMITAIALGDGYRAKLCSWLMDDQNVAASEAPDELVGEYLEKCSLRLFTHPELRDAYERKFGRKSYLLPAIVPARLVAAELVPPPEARRRGALIGSFWDQVWFDRTCAALRGCGWTIDWFGTNKSPWLRFPPEELERAGIVSLGLVPEETLVRRLREYPFVIVPAGTFEKQELNTGVARLSLPGRILFAVATSHTPVLVLGSEETCGARFVRHFEVGAVAPYDTAAIREAIARLAAGDAQLRLRRNAARIADRLSGRGVGEWLRESIERGVPADSRFEELFAGYDTSGALAPLDIRPWRPNR